MRTSAAGLALIEDVEGRRHKAYQDGGGVWTIGVGHTRGVKKGDTATDEQIDEWLREDAEEAEATILRHINAKVFMALPQAAWDALVSFVFNLGEQAFVNRNGSLTGVARALNAERYEDVPLQMARWIYDNGQRVTGLVRRRVKEIALWNSGFAA